MKYNAQTKKIIEYMKGQGVEINDTLNLKFDLLNTAIHNLKNATDNLNKEGLVINTNGGRTICVNPNYKVQREMTQTILKILREVGIMVKDEIGNAGDDTLLKNIMGID